ncbi:unnamed protein product [Lactuca saligna]|uniref:Protein LURP-one-related 15 n=1 Tax=Lactuca saligna TaxID=75948 RepID=A0AA36EMK6_LACSI|nr:unnamed protein product [Lactuca saligna]
MAQPNSAPLSSPVSVIGSQFMSPYQRDIIVDRNPKGNIFITDMSHNTMLKVKRCDTSFHYQRVLLDVDDKPIVTMRKKTMSEHDRWNVFMGDSKSTSDMIFTTKSHHVIQFKTNVHVFLANQTGSKNICDFKITGSWSKKNCTIYMGDTSTTIAQVNKMPSSENVKLVKDKFMVTIYPNVDYAFVVTLIGIVEAMKSSNTNGEVAAGSGVGAVLGAVIGSVFS